MASGRLFDFDHGDPWWAVAVDWVGLILFGFAGLCFAGALSVQGSLAAVMLAQGTPDKALWPLVGAAGCGLVLWALIAVARQYDRPRSRSAGVEVARALGIGAVAIPGVAVAAVALTPSAGGAGLPGLLVPLPVAVVVTGYGAMAAAVWARRRLMAFPPPPGG